MVKIIEGVTSENWEKILKLVKYENYLAARLHTYMEIQKTQLKILEDVKKTAEYLANFKRGDTKSWFKSLDPEIKKTIEKYGRFY